MKEKLKNRVLTISMVMVLLAIIVLGLYIYFGIHQKLPFTANSTYETKMLDSYNYKSDYSTVIQNSNKNMLDQFATLDNTSCISQLTIQAMMYNVASKDSKKVNTLFKRYDNGYKDFASADRIFKNTTIFYANNKPFTLQYVNNLVNTQINTKVDLFKDESIVEKASAIGVYSIDLDFDEETTSSMMNTIMIEGQHFVATTTHFDVIKIPLTANKTAVVVANNGLEENISYEQYISELEDIESLDFRPTDVQLEIYPFTKAISGVPGSVLTDLKENMIDWDKNFNDLLIVNYVNCENKAVNSNDLDSDSESNEYSIGYILKNNYLLLIQDNNTKLIELICDLTE